MAVCQSLVAHANASARPLERVQRFIGTHPRSIWGGLNEQLSKEKVTLTLTLDIESNFRGAELP